MQVFCLLESFRFFFFPDLGVSFFFPHPVSLRSKNLSAKNWISFLDVAGTMVRRYFRLVTCFRKEIYNAHDGEAENNKNKMWF